MEELESLITFTPTNAYLTYYVLKPGCCRQDDRIKERHSLFEVTSGPVKDISQSYPVVCALSPQAQLINHTVALR